MKVDLEKTIESFNKLAEVMNELQKTLLLGWPNRDLPTETEALQIQTIFHELGMHRPELSENTRWRIAGNCVARFRLEVPKEK